MQAHIKNLGLSSTREYKNWCRSHNFSQGLNKNTRQRRKELDFSNRIKATEILRRKKREGSSVLESVIRFVCALEIRLREDEMLKEPSPEEVATDIASSIHIKNFDFGTRQAVEAVIEVFRKSHHPQLLQDCLLHIEKHSNLLQRKDFWGCDGFNAIIHEIREIVEDRDSWVRPVEHWRPKKKRPADQFSELIRYCFARYPVPRFFDAAWRRGGIQKAWWREIAAGRSIRTAVAEDLPITLTKKMAHLFMRMPNHLSPEEAIVSAQVLSVDGSRHLVRVLCKKFGVDNLAYWRNLEDDDWRMWEIYLIDNEFWLNVIRFFNTDPNLNAAEIDLMIDYIIYKRAETDFRMKGRTTDALLRQAKTWQQHGGSGNGTPDPWESSGIGEFHYQYQEVDASVCIRELLSPADLVNESKSLSHCVGRTSTYAMRCYEGEIAIFTMEVKADSKCHKRLTIEVSLQDDTPQITQVSGLKNRSPREDELKFIEAWAAQEGLKTGFDTS